MFYERNWSWKCLSLGLIMVTKWVGKSALLESDLIDSKYYVMGCYYFDNWNNKLYNYVIIWNMQMIMWW